MRFSTSRPGKNNEYFVTKLGRRDNVGKIYKHQIRWRSVAKWRLNVVVIDNGFVTFFVHLFLFFSVSSASPQVAILVRIARLMAQKSYSDWYTSKNVEKIYVTIIQYAGRLHPGFRKAAAIFFTIWPIFTKLSANIGTSIKNVSMTLKMHSCQNSKWRMPPSSIWKTFVISLLFD